MYKALFTLFLLSSLLKQTALTQSSLPSFSEPSISPNGNDLAFVSGGDIWTVSIKGGDAHLLVSHPATESNPLYSPDGKRLAFTSTRTGNGDVYILTFETGVLKRLTFDEVGEIVSGWRKDGNRLYFHSTVQDIAGMNDIYTVSIDGGTPMPYCLKRVV